MGKKRSLAGPLVRLLGVAGPRAAVDTITNSLATRLSERNQTRNRRTEQAETASRWLKINKNFLSKHSSSCYMVLKKNYLGHYRDAQSFRGATVHLTLRQSPLRTPDLWSICPPVLKLCCQPVFHTHLRAVLHWSCSYRIGAPSRPSSKS